MSNTAIATGVSTSAHIKNHAGDDAIWSERQLPTQNHSDDFRTPFEIDYSRIIHSASFRRLQGKTQILTATDGDFHRTRMSHSLEVAQVGRGIVKHIRHSDDRHDVQSMLPELALMDSICLIHDLGHPPFGHGGSKNPFITA